MDSTSLLGKRLLRTGGRKGVNRAPEVSSKSEMRFKHVEIPYVLLMLLSQNSTTYNTGPFDGG